MASSSASASEIKKSARLAMMELANMVSVPMALNAVVRLDVPNVLSRSSTPLSASDILSALSLPSSPASVANLQRLLRLLTAHSVFAEHLGPSRSRRYSLTEIGKTLADDGDGNSFGPYVLQHHQDALIRPWPLLHEAVTDPAGPEPFARANGMPAYEYYAKDEEANDLMRRAMRGMSVPFMEAFLDWCGRDGGLDGVETLVDVGGSSGACLSLIMGRVEGVKIGVNFDLPEVVAGAPAFPGIIHVGGDMFKFIPQGDAIFMKWVLTTWTDEECEMILRNCYNALPEGGKVIACEPVVPEETDGGQRTRALLEGDVFVMTIYRSQGKERTEDEFRKIGIAAGFPNFRAIYSVDHFYAVLEFHK